MDKILQVAVREFLATVATKGFIIGMLATPAIIGIVLVALPMFMNEEPPKIDGEVAVIDPTGAVTAGLADYLQPEAVARRRQEFQAKVGELLPSALGGGAAMDQAMEAALGTVPELDVRELDASSDIEAEKKPLLEGTPQDGGRLALAVVHRDAIEPTTTDEDGEPVFGAYDLFIREKLDERLVDEIRDGLRTAIIDARIERRQIERQDILALRLPRVAALTVTEKGERENTEILNIFLPMGFMLLLFISTMSSGQYLMTTTIEEKSSRVVEVILSALSPMELMTGKILGQLLVGFLILGLYAGLGMIGLVSFAVLDLVDPMLLVYLVIFYLIAYFVLGSLMAAIGSAVSELREAQSFMAPVMLTVMVPWILWMPISRNPDSVLSVTMSMLPPVNSYVMLLRLTSTTPPPAWQVWLSIAIGVASVFGALWLAAKVFRIGLLMHGKPPSFATLLRWVRMA